MFILYFALALMALFLLWLGQGVRRIGAISRGAKINDRPGTALLLVDLQTVFWDHGPYTEEAKTAVEAKILKEIEAAKASKSSVIAVRQEWSYPSTKMIARLTMKGQAIEGTSDLEIAAPFAEQADHLLVKHVQDAFETGELDQLLAELDVGHLRIAGLDFNYCVSKTAQAARNRGYTVTVVRDGTLSAAETTSTENRLTARGIELI